MEPDVMVVYPSKPSLDVGDFSPEGEAFGRFSDGISVESPPSNTGSSAPTPAPHQSDCSSRPTSSMSSFDDQDDPSMVLSNGSTLPSPLEETGFADLAVLTEDAAHSWCCGFSPAADQWSKEMIQSHHSKEVVMEPKSTFVRNNNTEVKHCVNTESQADVLDLSCVGDVRDTSLQITRRRFAGEGQVLLSSFCDDVMFEGHSEDLEHKVSSLTSQGDRNEDEEMNFSRLDEVIDNRAAQETSATSSEEKPASEVDVDGGGSGLGSLPPSDSFADFCSAPVEDEEDELWEEFEEHRTEKVKGRDHGEEEQSTTICSQATMSDQVQNLVHNIFPEEDDSEEEELEVQSLGALLHLSGFKEEKETVCVTSQRLQRGCWWTHEDFHAAVGLRFQWAGSHSSRSLLRCLGMDTKNIVFIGVKKQPVCVPAFASGLGLLEPTKDSVTGCCSSEPANSKQDPLCSNQLVCSSRRLSSSQDGGSELNLDYFGPSEERRSSSGPGSPPPGVDPEIYELTICDLESSVSVKSFENALNVLMSASENTLVKRLDQEDLSPEASRMLSGLPSLSFMKAQFLMFPFTLEQEQ